MRSHALMPLQESLAATLTPAQMLARCRARDVAFDGRFLTGVLSTGIYCLPSCPARKPKPENVRFFATEGAARAAGLRPCRRCKPDRFYADRDPEVELAEELADEVRRAPGEFADVRALARRAGLGSTQLARLVRRHFHTTPAELLQAARVEHACRALHASDARVLDVALDAGFESSSAFHENFQRRVRTTPQGWRALKESARFELALPRGFRAADAMAAIARDPLSVSERGAGARCVLALRLDEGPARVALAIDGARARCELESGSETVSQRAGAHDVLRRLLGLHGGPDGFERRARRSPALARLVAQRPGARVSVFADAWEAALWAMLGQAVTLRLACARRRELALLAGLDSGDGLRTTATPARVAELGPARLASIGLSRAQADALAKLAGHVADGTLALESLARGSAVRAERHLLAQRGVGPWTAQYVMMRGLGLADCAPAGDSALATALERAHGLEHRPKPDEVRALMEAHAPDRSLATWHFWQSLGDDV